MKMGERRAGLGPSWAAKSMKTLAALLLLLPHRAARAGEADAAIERIFAQVETLARGAPGGTAADEKDREHRISLLKPEVLRWKEAAVPPLSRIAMDSRRPLKVRVWAVSFAALVHDISALPAFKRLLLDPEQPSSLREAAAQDIAELGASKDEMSRAYCPLFAEKTLPPGVFHSALLHASSLGCDEAKGLEWWAKRWGPDPKDKDLRAVERLVSALARSRPLEATRALFRLFDHFRRGTFPRRLILEALAARNYQLKALGGEATRFLRQAAIAEARNLPAALAAVALLSAVEDRGAVGLLIKLLANEHPEVAAAAAETLARFKAPQARAPLEKLLAGIHKDPRFFPDHNEPEKLAARIEAALKSLPVD